MRTADARLLTQLTGLRRPFRLGGIVAIAILVGTCSQPPPLLEQVRELGELRIATRNSPTAYYLGRLGPEGPEYELAAAFADQLGVPLMVQIVPSQAAAVEAVRRRQAHLAAAGLAVTDAFRSQVDFGPVYQRVRLHVVGHRGGPRAADPAALVGRSIEVPAGSAHAEALEQLRRDHPELTWKSVPGAAQLDLMARVSGRQADFTIADSWEFSLGRHFHPELEVAFDTPDSESFAWAVPRHAPDLLAAVRQFFASVEQSGRLKEILDRYYRASQQFDFVDSLNFVRHVEARLPPLRPLFEAAAAEVGVDWRLLAAIGYQESKWDASAVSPTGVRGIMMLTEDTARRVGVRDRRDPVESIRGGAIYYREVEQKLPSRIAEPDRTWLALAAYNVGFGHLEDARILAQRAGRNPDRWEDVRKYLPLLAQEQHFTQTRRGYARGWEPVHFVGNVQTYLRLIEWMGGDPQAELRLRARAPGGSARAPASAPDRRPPRS